MYVKLFFSFLFSGLVIQILKIFNTINTLKFLNNLKKYFFPFFNQIYLQKLDTNFKCIFNHIEKNLLTYSNKLMQYLPEFDRNLKSHSKLITFTIINKILYSIEQKDKVLQFGVDFYSEILSNITFHREILDKEILFLLNPFILIFNSISLIINLLFKFIDFKFSKKLLNLSCMFITFLIFLIGYIKIYRFFTA
jgi:hypothetical protein